MPCHFPRDATLDGIRDVSIDLFESSRNRQPACPDFATFRVLLLGRLLHCSRVSLALLSGSVSDRPIDLDEGNARAGMTYSGSFSPINASRRAGDLAASANAGQTLRFYKGSCSADAPARHIAASERSQQHPKLSDLGGTEKLPNPIRDLLTNKRNSMMPRTQVC